MINYMNYRQLCGMLITGILHVCPIYVSAAGLGMTDAAGDVDYSAKVLIVSNKNKLNDPVILKVKQILETDGNYVKLATGTNLEGMQANQYGAIIIVNFVEDKNKDRSVEVQADESVQKRIVLLNAVGDYLASDKNQASSKIEKSNKIASEIIEKTKIILSGQ